MERGWRPKRWKNPHTRSIDFGHGIESFNEYPAFAEFEAGAAAMLDALTQLASESSIGAFVIDSRDAYAETLSVGESATLKAPSTEHGLNTTSFNGNKRE